MRGRRRYRSEMTALATTLVLVVPGAMSNSSLCPSDNTTIGYSDLSSLQTSLLEENQTNYTLCPNTTFLVNAPLAILSKNRVFSCGDGGLLENNCVFESTALPFVLLGDSQDVLMKGITFRGVDEATVLDSYSCEDCQFESACFSEVDNLVTALEAQTVGQEFRLCPDTIFSMEGHGPLVIRKDNITIQCGESGAKAEDCGVWGGETQIEIQGDGVRLRGLTMLASKRVSVLCSGDSDYKASMEGCEWSGHTGVAAVAIYNGTLDDISSYDDIATAVGALMRVEFEICSFRDNQITLATIVNVDSAIVSLNTTYEGNSGETVITTTGETSIQGSCFVHNNVTTSGVVHISEASLLISDSTFNGNGNIGGAAGCVGVYAESDGSCVDFTNSSCATVSHDSESPPAADQPSQNTSIATLAPVAGDTCISGWDALLVGVNTQSGGSVNICNATEFDFSEGLEPLHINTSNVIVDCPSCVFRGGSQHMILQGSISNVTIRGISFTGASSQSIFANLSIPSSVVFEDCQWIDNRGSAAVWLENMDLVPTVDSGKPADDPLNDKDDDIFPDRLLRDGSLQVSFVCDQCVFDSNTGRDGILVSSGVSLDLSKVVFDSNRAEREIIKAKNAEVTISLSCFTENLYGARLMDTDFAQAFSERNFGANNTKTGGLEPCDGLGTAVLCLPFEATTCLALDNNATTTPLPPPVPDGPCFSDWEALSEAFEAATPENKTVFMICENTTIVADKPIIIANDAAMQCGLGGSSDNNCTVRGGISHFVLKGFSISVSFAGIIFKEAEVISIMAFASSDSRAIFSDCTWTNHLGPAAVLVYNEIDGIEYDGDQHIENLVSSDRPAMSTTFESCYFLHNEPSFAALAVVDGRTEVISSAFQGNELMTAGVIVGTVGTKLTLQRSCFFDNQALTSGTVYLDSRSELIDHDHLLMGDSNIAGSDSDCHDILESTLDTCLDNGVCLGFCTPFEADVCDLPFLNSRNDPSIPSGEDNDSNMTDVEKELTPILFKPASLNALVITNIFVILLTIIGGIFMYTRCTKKHSESTQQKEGGPTSNPETADLLGNLSGRLGFGKKALSTMAEVNSSDEDDDEESGIFHDEPPKESRPLDNSSKGVRASTSNKSKSFGISKFEDEDDSSSSDSDESESFLGGKMESSSSLMLGNSSSGKGQKAKKKKKLRVMKKIKRTTMLIKGTSKPSGNKGGGEVVTSGGAGGSESNLTRGSKLSYENEFYDSAGSDVFGNDYDLSAMF